MEQLVGPIEQVIDDLKKKWNEQNGEESLRDVLLGFFHAVDWKEPWIIALVTFQFVLLVSVIVFRKQQTWQGLVFTVAAGIVYFSERINGYAAQQWERFATQPYFDKHGVFFSTLVSGPLLVCMFIILVNYLIEASDLLVKVKRQQLRQRARELQKAVDADTAGKKVQ